MFEYGNFGIKDVQFYNPTKSIDISANARASGSDNPGFTEYTATDIKVE